MEQPESVRANSSFPKVDEHPRVHEDQDAETSNIHSATQEGTLISSSEHPNPLKTGKRSNSTDRFIDPTHDLTRARHEGGNGVSVDDRPDDNTEAPKSATITPPKHEPNPSDDVSLNIAVDQPEDVLSPARNVAGQKNDDTINEERRVAFLPPPRMSPVFIPPRSSYPVGPPPIGSAYGTPPMGQIGVHYPREIVRIERDYSGGELPQFHPTYPIELEGRITPTQWLDTVNGINEILISAHSLKRAAVHHVLAVVTLYVSSMLIDSHYEKEMSRLRTFIDQCNEQLYHSQGLNILWPRQNGFLFLEIEYY